MNQNLSPRRRALSLLLTLSLLLGLLPAPALAAEPDGAAEADAVDAGTPAAEHWAASYLDQMVEWGFIRADQAASPDRPLTRADFMSIVNRAYGYHETGPTPFEDVSEFDWFYDDVGIAYTAGYINGTSATTASPNETLDRETAATILGRNMMLQESPGELVDFSDARDISNWARGTIKSSMEHYMVSGYEDGTFRPHQAMSWGEIAALVSRTVGTPLQDEGDYALGGVFGNVTVTSPGVTLRDTVISGDLYVTAGVGLGGIKLENVTVLGRIIASGTGSSEGGASILLRNVTADELLVDNLRDKEVSIQADGITEIGRTTVRSSAYIQDNTPEGLGLHTISLEGDSYGEGETPPAGWAPPRLTLAGRVGEVINRTPDSIVHAAKGTVAKLTVDETATGSGVVIDRGTVVKDLVLDTGVNVTGEGDVVKLEVNAPGSRVDMLPDQIEIRPGTTAVISGGEMDSATAEEFLLEPMILAGYPRAQDIAPTSLEAVFNTNKRGRIYWAVSAIADGSIGADDLIKPPSYGSKSVRRGTIDAPRGNEEVTTRITGLAPGSEYYLSAVLEDQKGQLSLVKVISFTTPDNTVPAFNSGYPHMSKVSPKDSCVVVSTKKDCQVYYALLIENATAPTESELKTGTVAGALGYGVVSVHKNLEETFRVNDQVLDQKAKYVLYMWLTDADGANKSAITSLTFTTDDETPPEFTMGPEVTDIKATSVSLTFRLSEDGTVYWVAVPAGSLYPKPQPGTEYNTAPLTSDYAKLQVYSGMNLGTGGKAGRVVAKENTDGTITVSGLSAETAYDFYYIAKDNAGTDRNYSVAVGWKTFNTLDDSGPKFTQSFSKPGGTDTSNTAAIVTVKSDTDIYLDISENVRYSDVTNGGGRGFKELYEDISTGGNAAINKLAQNLAGAIKLCKSGTGNADEDPAVPSITKVSDRDKFKTDETIVIDYTRATVTTRKTGGIRITFPAEGLRLQNGAEYYFVISDITDTSNNQNELDPAEIDFKHHAGLASGKHDVRPFNIEFATVDFEKKDPSSYPVRRASADGELEVDENGNPVIVEADMTFRLKPQSTANVSDDVNYDMIFWAADTLRYDLYYRVIDATTGVAPVKEKEDKSGYEYDFGDTGLTNANLFPYNGEADQTATNARTVDSNGWMYLGDSQIQTGKDAENERSGRSLNKTYAGCTSARSFPQLNKLSQGLIYEFVIRLSYYGNSADRTVWKDRADIYVQVAAGQGSILDDLSGSLRWAEYRRVTQNGLTGGAESIGRWTDGNGKSQDWVWLYRTFTDLRTPRFTSGTPVFTPTATSVSIEHHLESKAEIYYMIVEAMTNTADPRSEPRYPAYRKIMDNDNRDDPNLVLRSGVDGQMAITLNGPNPPPTSGLASTMPAWMKGGTGDVDDPDQPNMIIDSPDKIEIWQQYDVSASVTDYGHFPSNRGATDPKVVTGLKPETDYFAYFVIKGQKDDPSHVYIYRFKTPKASKPKIQLKRYSAGANRGGATITTTEDAFLDYIVFSVSDAEYGIPLLQKPVTVTKAYADRNPDISTAQPDGTYTVTTLDALLTLYEDEEPTMVGSDFRGFSVFDVFANRELKGEMSTFLHGNYSQFLTDYVQPVTSKNLMSFDKNKPRDETISAMTANGQYIILAVAHAKDATGDEADYDTYKAHAPLYLGDAKAVDIESWDASLTVGVKSEGPFDGWVRITFDNRLYNGNRVPLTESMLLDPIYTQMWTTGILDRINISLQNTDQSQAVLLFNAKSGQGWKHNDTIYIPRTLLKNVNGFGESDLTIKITDEGSKMRVTLTWSPQKSPPYIEFSFQQASISITFVDTNGIKLSGNPQEMMIGAQGTNMATSEPVVAEIWERDPNATYSWSIESGGDLINLKYPSADGSAINTPRIEIESKGSDGGVATVRLRVTAHINKVEVTNSSSFLVRVIQDLRLSGVGKDLGFSGNIITWPLDKIQTGVIEIDCGKNLSVVDQDVTIRLPSGSTGTCPITKTNKGATYSGSTGIVTINTMFVGGTDVGNGTSKNIIIDINGRQLELTLNFTGSQAASNFNPADSSGNAGTQ